MHRNLIAYDNFELITDEEEIKEYRRNKLDGCQKELDFIQSEATLPIRLIEIGSGNCKIPIGLEKKGLIEYAIGLDVSSSRTKFAQDWVDSEDVHKVSPIQKNALTFKFDENNGCNLYLALDIIWHFWNPIEQGSDERLLKELYSSLTHGGKVIMEFCDLTRYIDVKTWEEFDEPDPWQFSLWDCKYDDKRKFLQWNKKFIERNTGLIDEKSIILQVYTYNEVIELFESVGFKNIKLYDDWDKSPFTGTQFEYIIVAEK